jgi:hypothetical protein
VEQLPQRIIAVDIAESHQAVEQFLNTLQS